MPSITIDRSLPLARQPHTGHNRYHPDIPPILEVAPGDDVSLETRDALDGQITPHTTAADLPSLDTGRVHPLTGPVAVQGAEPGDALEVEFREIAPQPTAFSAIIPGLGFLRDRFSDPYLVHWTIDAGFATSPQLPGLRIPGAPFMGVSATAPGPTQLAQWTAREQRLLDRGGFVLPPRPAGAVPAGGDPAAHGLRTLPPRENGGNVDVKQLSAGARLFLPVFLPGAGFSTGDAHFAQGDGEVCVTAVEMAATVTVRFHLHKGLAARRTLAGPVFARSDDLAPPQPSTSQRFLAVMGMPLTPDGENESEDLTLAARNAVLGMIELLGERGYSPEQAYVICSVAVDLRISNTVDLPNVVVSAFLPEAIFDHA